MKRVSLRFAVLMPARSIEALVLVRSRRRVCKYFRLDVIISPFLRLIGQKDSVKQWRRKN